MNQKSEQEIIRRKSLECIKSFGINPYPEQEYKITNYSTNIIKNFDSSPELYKKVCIAGRIMSVRNMGKASFIELQDNNGRIQCYIARDSICKNDDKTLYNEIFKKYINIGDIVGIKGFVFKTKVGETTVHAEEFTILSKSLRPLPIVKTDQQGTIHDAFTDSEMRYRQRYVDLIVNQEVKETFIARTKIINSMRNFFNKSGYLEVETPILQLIPGGAIARPFITHHNALNIPLYLRIANELYLKRLIVGGFEGVYEFSKDFRNEGMDNTHNPEFTMLEIYVAYKDYIWMIDYTEQIIQNVVKAIKNETKITFNGKIIDFKTPFYKISMTDAIKKYTNIDITNKTEEDLRKACKQLNIEVDDSMGKGKIIDAIFGEKCEPKFIQPTFITDYPIEMSPLSKKHRNNPNLTERFELIINGKEIANAYTELNDPIEQKKRFEEQFKLLQKGDDESMFIYQDFIRALEYGMPPTAGLGIGIDRLTMLITDNKSIQEVLFFPQMKKEKIRIPIQELTEDENLILDFLKTPDKIKINELRFQIELSNKKWDTAIKGLREKKIVTVFKEENLLYIQKILIHNKSC